MMGKATKPEIPQVSKDSEDDEFLEIMEGENDDIFNIPSSSSSSSFENSAASSSSSLSTSSDMADDASSSPTSSSNSDRSSYDLSELTAQLPIKRGLSKYYDGKSQSYTSLSRVTSLEDLIKKAPAPCRRKMKASKSYGGGLDSYKSYTLPKPTISKKAASKGSLLSSSLPPKRGSLLGNCKPPLAPAAKGLRC